MHPQRAWRSATAAARLAINYGATRVEAFEDAWLDAQLDAREALAAWGGAPAATHDEAFAVYRAALVREECAAGALRHAQEVQPARPSAPVPVPAPADTAAARDLAAPLEAPPDDWSAYVP